MLDSLSLRLCQVQGRVFEMSGARGFASERFIEAYMTGDVAAHFDLPFDHLQWAGEEYIFGELVDLNPDLPKAPTDGVDLPSGTEVPEVYPGEVLYWVGYLYRYWHYVTGESSCEIYAVADAPTMLAVYEGFHAIDNDLAIENLKLLHEGAPHENGEGCAYGNGENDGAAQDC